MDYTRFNQFELKMSWGDTAFENLFTHSDRQVESIKITSMEIVSTGVLQKLKNI